MLKAPLYAESTEFSAIKISVQFNLHDSGFAKETQREKMRG